MPRYDGQGPVWGGGPGAGWGAGPCGAGMGFRRGCGRGFGRGMSPRSGMNYQNPVNWTKKDQLNALSEEQKMLKEDLQAIEKEIQDLKGAKK